MLSVETLTFCEDNFNFNDAFVMVRIIDENQVWIEGAKICQLFGYLKPWQAIEYHVSATNKRKLSVFTNSSYTLKLLVGDDEESVRNLSRDLILINEAAIWELSQHLQKPILKRFWQRMCKTLSEHYNMVYNVKQNEVFAMPKSTETPMEVDPIDRLQYVQLKLELERERREKAELREASQRENSDLRISLIESQNRERETWFIAKDAQTRYLFQMDRSLAVDSMHLDALDTN